MDIVSVVKNIVSNKTSIEGIDETTELSSLGLNSIDLVEITLEIEDVFHIDFTSSEIVGLKTINDVIKLIERKTK